MIQSSNQNLIMSIAKIFGFSGAMNLHKNEARVESVLKEIEALYSKPSYPQQYKISYNADSLSNGTVFDLSQVIYIDSDAVMNKYPKSFFNLLQAGFAIFIDEEPDNKNLKSRWYDNSEDASTARIVFKNMEALYNKKVIKIEESNNSDNHKDIIKHITQDLADSKQVAFITEDAELRLELNTAFADIDKNLAKNCQVFSLAEIQAHTTFKTALNPQYKKSHTYETIIEYKGQVIKLYESTNLYGSINHACLYLNGQYLADCAIEDSVVDKVQSDSLSDSYKRYFYELSFYYNKRVE